MESDFEDDLADVVEDSDTKFVVEDKDNDTDVQDEKINKSSNVLDSAAKSKDDALKVIHLTKSTRYINAQKECTKSDIDLLDNPLKVFKS